MSSMSAIALLCSKNISYCPLRFHYIKHVMCFCFKKHTTQNTKIHKLLLLYRKVPASNFSLDPAIPTNGPGYVCYKNI